jgi:NitT/TauT family transport system substrate-binding protein
MRMARSLIGGALIAAVLAAASSPAAGAPSFDTLRVSFGPQQSNAGLFIADKEGFFAAERIKVNWTSFQGSVQFTPVLAQGQLDIGAGSISAAFFNAVAAGLKIRVVADKGHVAARGTVGSLVIRRDLAGTIRTAADLKGRKITINAQGALGHYLVFKILAGAGLTTDHITLVTMPFASTVAALQGGSVDAGVLPAPLDTQAIELGVGVRLVDFADIILGEPTAFIFMGPTLLDGNRPLAVRFLTAYLRALRRYNEGPTPRNVAVVAEFTRIEPEIVRKGGWIGIHADGYVDVARLRRYQDWLYEIGLISVRNPLTTVADTTVVDQARAALGLPPR